MRFLVVFAMAACAFGQARESTKTAKINEIFRLSKVDQLQKQMTTQVQALVAAQLTQSGLQGEAYDRALANSKKVLSLSNETMSWEKLKPSIVRMYDETFSEDEISGMLMFYESDSGRAMLEKMPLLQAKTMAMIQERMKTIIPEIQKMAEQDSKAPR